MCEETYAGCASNGDQPISSLSSSSFFDGASFCPVPCGSFLPQFNRFYFHYSRQAFNMAQFLVRELRFDDSVFHTALHYWHRFVAIHGLRALNEVLLIAASVFLAAKVAHYKFSAKQLVLLAFDITPGSNENGHSASSLSSAIPGTKKSMEEEVEPWRRAVLDTELLLCDTLQFQFHIPNPIRQMEDVLGLAAEKEGFFASPYSSSPSSFRNDKDEEEQQEEKKKEALAYRNNVALLTQLIARVKRLQIFLLIAPLQACVTAEERSVAILLIVIRYSLLYPRKEATCSLPISQLGDSRANDTTNTTVITLINDSSQLQRFAESVGKIACAVFFGGERERNNALHRERACESEDSHQPHFSFFIPEKVVEGVLGVIVETFSLMKKSTDIPLLDELIANYSEKQVPAAR